MLSRVKGTQMVDVLSAQGTSFIQLISRMGQPSPGHGVTRRGDRRLPSRNSAGQGDMCGALGICGGLPRTEEGSWGGPFGRDLPWRISGWTRWARAPEVA